MRWLLVISISSILSRAVRSYERKTDVWGRLLTVTANMRRVWSSLCLDQVLFFQINRCFLFHEYSRPRNQRFKGSGYDYVWNACRSVSELFEWQVSSVLGSYLPLKFSFLCFQFIFYLFWIICGRFISGHLSFKSVYLQDNYFNELLQLCFSINHYLFKINKYNKWQYFISKIFFTIKIIVIIFINYYFKCAKSFF